ncbi:MAG: Anaerobic nitric oxide reductase transcription regulator NorR [Syntrophorhabdaceae bacterium]|nr:Anaerobic nitric oxide reductase transcription regulator NorR [Syntrophorhabdaceae bacterium]
MDTTDTRSQKLLTLAKELLLESDLHRLLSLAMDRAVEASGAERGMIILFGKSGETLFETARNLKKEEIDHPEFKVSRTIINKAKTEGTAICLRNALEDPALRQSSSAARLKLLSVICLPLRYEDKIFGVVYLDNRTVRGIFAAETGAFMQDFADFISLAAHRALEQKCLRNHVNALESELRGKYKFEAIIGHHPKIVAILKLVAKIADTDATVLIQGESGTGKELIAQALHYNSRRRHQPFVPINCAALPENLLESELFGHVRGAFTGAIKDHAGWFERAEGGTIFLDEVNDMPLPLQLKLLRVLQTGEFSRVGSTELRHCHVRVIAASSVNLSELVTQKKFREELLYRLKVIELTLPPLRERGEDILLLAQHFLQQFSAKHGKAGLRLSEEAEGALLSHDFPGNVRELENLIQRAVVTTEGETLATLDLPIPLAPSVASPQEKWSSFHVAKQHVVETFERQYLTDCLRLAKGNLTQAAKLADLHVTNLYHKLHQYRIDPAAFKP